MIRGVFSHSDTDFFYMCFNVANKEFISFLTEDNLMIRTFIKSISKTSFFMNQFITRDKDDIAEAKVHLVFVNKDGKPVKIPEEIYKKFQPFFCDSIKI